MAEFHWTGLVSHNTVRSSPGSVGVGTAASCRPTSGRDKQGEAKELSYRYSGTSTTRRQRGFCYGRRFSSTELRQAPDGLRSLCLARVTHAIDCYLLRGREHQGRSRK